MYPHLKRTSREARAVGALLFFPETYCRNPTGGHLAPRRLRSGQCTACLEVVRVNAQVAAAGKRARARKRRDAPKVAAREERAKFQEAAKEAAKAQRRAEREARARARAAAKAQATREANARRSTATPTLSASLPLGIIQMRGDGAPWAT